jgi:pimeloyl-ACP methyl ester carboxylesterase
MIPNFFGSSDKPLFGVYHPPRTARPRDSGVLLCYPAPQEYMRTHWAFRKLAVMLAKEGFHVFRFDYFGTGDSSGKTEEGRLATWRENIVTAARELKDLASVSKVSAVGFRLGATLAATAPGLSLTDLVLWEPVVRGLIYLGELELIQAKLLSTALKPRWRPSERPAELLGFAFPPALEEELRTVDLVRDKPPRASRAAIMISDDRPVFRELHASYEQRGLPSVYKHVPDEIEAGRSSSLGAALLSNVMLEAIVSHLARR